jgi:hypothetical protein
VGWFPIWCKAQYAPKNAVKDQPEENAEWDRKEKQCQAKGQDS